MSNFEGGVRGRQSGSGTARPTVSPNAAEGAWPQLEAQLSKIAQSTSRSGDAEFASAQRIVLKASKAIDILQERCRRLESEVRDISDRFKDEIDASEQTIKDWERLSTAIKVQLSKSETSLAEANAKLKAADEQISALQLRALDIEVRLQASDARAQEAEAKARAAEHAAAQQKEMATALRTTIFETFGSGSSLAAVLNNELG